LTYFLVVHHTGGWQCTGSGTTAYILGTQETHHVEAVR